MTEEQTIRMRYAGAIGLLCAISTNVTDPDYKDMIDQCVNDFCKSTGWTWERLLDRVEVFPPENEAT